MNGRTVQVAGRNLQSLQGRGTNGQTARSAERSVLNFINHDGHYIPERERKLLPKLSEGYPKLSRQNARLYSYLGRKSAVQQVTN